jgi:DNA-binding NarL/FixJ family response regulator
MIRILIADDHVVVRRGLIAMLDDQRDLEVVAQAADGESAIALAGETHPDVALIDLAMPGLDGIETTRRLVAEHPGMNVAILTSFAERERVLAALEAGAIGFLLKDADPEELIPGIRLVAAGDSPFAAAAAKALVPEHRSEGGLSERERAVLALVAAGCPNKEVAHRLGISEKTVKAHLTRIFQRIGVSDRFQAGLWARAHGITADR